MLKLIKQKLTSFIAEHNEFDTDISRIVCLEGSDGLIDGCCCIIFDSVQDIPILIAKAARSNHGKSVYKIDFENLKLLEEKGMNKDRAQTPTPLAYWEIDGVLITLQSALPGRLMKNTRGADFFSPANISNNIAMIMTWCSHFQSQFGIKLTKISSDIYEREILEPVKKFKSRFILNDRETDFLDNIFENERPLLNVELPYMVRHGDFCTANLVIQTDGMGVFDWEYPLHHQPPLLDLLFFFSSVRYPYSGLRGESTYHDSFLTVYWEDNYFNDVLKSCLKNYCEKYDIEWGLVAYLFLIFLIQIANRKYDNFLKSNGVEESSDLDNQVSNDDKAIIWKQFRKPDKNVPFACIKNGISKNVSVIVEKGFPKFMGI